MTFEERELILDAVATADGGCSQCVRELLDILETLVPKGSWKAAFGPLDVDNISARGNRARRARWASDDDVANRKPSHD
jgi:hypothetical protein